MKRRSPEEIIELRERWKQGESYRSLALRYRMTASGIGAVISGQCFKYVPGALTYEERMKILGTRRKVPQITKPCLGCGTKLTHAGGGGWRCKACAAAWLESLKKESETLLTRSATQTLEQEFVAMVSTYGWGYYPDNTYRSSAKRRLMGLLGEKRCEELVRRIRKQEALLLMKRIRVQGEGNERAIAACG